MTVIDSTNIDKHYKDIVEAIKIADFIAFDCEFTGLRHRHPRFPRIGNQDSNQDIYERYRFVGQNYHLLQIGISCFWFNKVTSLYEEKTYSFFIQPKGEVPRLFQMSCVQFISHHNFDCTRAFKNGLGSVLLLSEDLKEASLSEGDDYADKICKGIEEQENLEKQMSDLVKNQHFGEEIKQVEKAWISEINETFGNFEDIEKVKEQFVEITFNNQLEMVYCKRRNTEIQKLVNEQNLQLQVNTKESPPKMKISMNSKPKKQEKDSQKCDKKEESFPKKAGISSIFIELIRSKKPIVGHYCIFDWFYCFSTCIDILPTSLEIFSKMMVQHFPYIYDTKTLAPHVTSSSTGLGTLYSLYLKRGPQTLEKGLVKSEIFQSNNEHDAGYDAFITGYLFLNLAIQLVYPKLNFKKLKEFDNSCLENLMEKLHEKNLNCKLHMGKILLDLKDPNDDSKRRAKVDDEVFVIEFREGISLKEKILLLEEIKIFLSKKISFQFDGITDTQIYVKIMENKVFSGDEAPCVKDIMAEVRGEFEVKGLEINLFSEKKDIRLKTLGFFDLVK